LNVPSHETHYLAYSCGSFETAIRLMDAPAYKYFFVNGKAMVLKSKQKNGWWNVYAVRPLRRSSFRGSEAGCYS